ncbi:HNH endonuclease signature motif containing protein [Pseudonocardia oceani]|uniref:HNH endonuclease signature motif containing protein n=1 Tax=Pseudonocardia oceani TaxID=2792013 RepID=UPI001C4A00FB|nr:HNH endonuclease signature motif containing protein [Pseudonocardia oceani]
MFETTLEAPVIPTVLPTPVDPVLTLPQLERELLGLAGRLAAAQSQFLTLLAEFDDRAGWAGPGLKSCAHWLSWRIGMSLRTAHEHVRVAHALRRLPLVAEAFAAGKLSYSKVRAITRVTVLPPAPPPEPAPLPDPPGTAAATGSPLAGSAPDAARAGAPVEDAAGPPDATDAVSPALRPSGPPPPTAPDAERTLLALALAGTASHVETVVRATRRQQTDAARLSARRSLSWRWADDGSLVVSVRLAPADGAALIAAIDAAAAPAPAPVRHPVPPSPPGWRERAESEYPGRAVDRLAARRADALLSLVTAPAPHADDESGPGASRSTVRRGQADVVVQVDVTDGAASIVGGPEIATATAERLACDARAQVLLRDTRHNRLYLGRRRRLASPAQIAALTVRDAGRCRFAGCTQARHLHAHHVVHWLRAGRTDLDNLVLLCGFHHTLVHERGFGIRWTGDGWESLRPDGTPVPATGDPLAGNVERLIEMQTRAELRIDPRGLTPSWGGERLDRDAVLRLLLPDGGAGTGNGYDEPDDDEEGDRSGDGDLGTSGRVGNVRRGNDQQGPDQREPDRRGPGRDVA